MKVSKEFEEAGFTYKQPNKNHPKYKKALEIYRNSYIRLRFSEEFPIACEKQDDNQQNRSSCDQFEP